MISADTKCKVSVGEPGFPIAAVSRGKAVIVGRNEVFKVGDHDFSKVSLIPDVILIHSIPENEEEEQEGTEWNMQSVGKWYTGKVFYSVKDMPTQGSSAMRGAAEVNTVLKCPAMIQRTSHPAYIYIVMEVEIGKIRTIKFKEA